MLYSDLYFKQKTKLPLPMVVVAILSILSFGLFFFGNSSQPTRASKKILKRHEIVNVSTTEGGIFWESEKKEVGWIVYGAIPRSVSTIALDERDSEGRQVMTSYHYVFLKNLNRDTTYYYKIVSGNETVTASQDKPFQLHTAKSVASLFTLKPAYGKVLQANGQQADNAIVLYYQKDAVPLLAVTKATGEWLIPLQYMINKNTGEPMSLQDSTQIKLEVLADDVQPTAVSAALNQTNPFPASIVEGSTPEVKGVQDPVVATAATHEAVSLGQVDIIFPKEGAVIPAVKPLLKGVALPDHEVTLSIDSSPVYTTRIVAGRTGEWKLELPIALPAGSYTLTALSDDDSGKKVTVRRKFTVAKSGEQVLGEATASAQVTSTPTPAPTAVPSPTVGALPNTGFTPTPSVLLKGGFSSDFLFFASFAFIILGAGFLIVF